MGHQSQARGLRGDHGGQQHTEDYHLRVTRGNQKMLSGWFDTHCFGGAHATHTVDTVSQNRALWIGQQFVCRVSLLEQQSLDNQSFNNSCDCLK